MAASGSQAIDRRAVSVECEFDTQLIEVSAPVALAVVVIRWNDRRSLPEDLLAEAPVETHVGG